MSKLRPIIIISSLLMLAPKVMFAAPATTQTSLTLSGGEQTFTIDAATIHSWEGAGLLPKKNPLRYEARPFEIAIAQSVGLLSSAVRDATGGLVATNYDISAIYDYTQSLAKKLNTQAKEGNLRIEDNRAVEFTPPQDGTSLDAYQSTINIISALNNQATSAALSLISIPPVIPLSQMNTLGINELVGHGVSNFKGSTSNRIHNIKIGVQRMQGIILAPGEEFSFNKYLGAVDATHGFLPELVIKKTGTVPEFGGGLCQVSSTTFRAAMAAGLPILERRNHAYAVSYYAPQGTDATIYPGVVDLKFTNNTPGHLLIWPYLQDKNTLVFDFYGTSDGRQVTLEKPVQWDKKADGSMKASWTRIVTKDGTTSSSTFKSIYQPPALFHKTEEFAKATSTSATTETATKTQ